MKLKKPEALRLILNLIFSIYHCVLGIATRSPWFLTVGAYYILLGSMRVFVLAFSKKEKRSGKFLMKFTGSLLFLLALVLGGIVYFTVHQDVAQKHHEIVMITIALYAFWKMTMALLGFFRGKNQHTPAFRTLQSISVTDAVVSIYSLQRSMLVTFDGLTQPEIVLFNVLSGIGMCVITLGIGCYLLFGKEPKQWQNQN